MVDHVIYHGGCVDGFTAAALLHRVYPSAVLHEGVYSTPPPDRLAGHVVLADFSYPPEVLAEIAARPRVTRVTLLDHHQTAVEQIAAWAGPLDVEMVLDQERSGAMLTFDWLIGTRALDISTAGVGVMGYEALVEYVQDRDLWRFELPHSRAVTAFINAQPMTFEAWDAIAELLHHAESLDRVVMAGEAVLSRNAVLIGQMKQTVRPITLDGGIVVPMSASPYGLGSDLAGVLAAESDGKIGGYYIDWPEKRQFGLRSTDDGPDVAKIAERYGGGGHPHASGFVVTRGSGHPLLDA